MTNPEHVLERYVADLQKFGTSTDKEEIVLYAARRIKDLEQQLAERQWISVEDRLPEPYEEVYIWPRPDFGVTQYAGYLSRRKGEKAFQWFSDTYETSYGIEENTVRVTHWLPLPEPPKV